MAGSGRFFIMRAVGEDEEESLPVKYLQQSVGPRPGVEHVQSPLSSGNLLNDTVQEACWEDRLSDLARVESVLKKRKAEVQELDALLMQRKQDLDDVVHKRKSAEGRLRRAEEDAGIIEQRAAETSAELIRAGNQLINLEIRGKAMNERQSHVIKILEAKSKELKEADKSYDVVRQNVDKLNKELGSKMEELENKEKHLREVETRIQLSLRVEELRQLIAQTEKEEKHQSEKYVRVLKEGEKALEEKTLQLARTRNEIQAQMTEYHELNSKINKLRTELKEVQVNLRKEKIEAFNLTEKRQREKRTREQQLKETEDKLAEINNARNESVDALKSHREEFALLRRKIQESLSKMKECEKLRLQKEAEYEKAIKAMNEDKDNLEKEMKRLESDKQKAEESLGEINGDLFEVMAELKTATEELEASKITKESFREELNELQETITEKRKELSKTTQETNDASKELEELKETIVQLQATQAKLVSGIRGEHEKTENHKIDSLPQESSTPRRNEKDDEAIITELRESIKQLSAENKEKHMALQEAGSELKELKEVVESEKRNFKEYMIQMASETEVYRKHIERLQMENAAEKQINTQEKGLLLHKVDEHRLKARKLSEELSALKQDHLKTRHELNQLRDTLAKDVKELKEHVEGITNHVKSELARSLQQVESSNEQTCDEIEHLREKDDEIEKQLSAIQQSINSAKLIALKAKKDKAMVSRREKEEALIRQQGATLQRQQTYLRAQIRQQMSTRAEALDEERKKAEMSLEGLKTKLKNLEEVITRKDSTVEDFRLKLLRSRVEAEKAADSNKQIDELKRRLRELEDEKDLVTVQRNHLASLNESARLDAGNVHSGLYVGDKSVGKTSTASQSLMLRRSLDSLTKDSFYTKPVKFELEMPCRDEVHINTSLPLEVHNSAQRNSAHDLNVVHSLTAPNNERIYPKREIDPRITEEHFSAATDSFEPNNSSVEYLTGQNPFDISNSSLKMTRKDLSVDRSDKETFRATNPENFRGTELPVSGLTSDPRELVSKDGEKLRQVERSPASLFQGSASFFADERKSEFLSSVHRLKNEKIKELELSLQRISLQWTKT